MKLRSLFGGGLACLVVLLFGAPTHGASFGFYRLRDQCNYNLHADAWASSPFVADSSSYNQPDPGTVQAGAICEGGTASVTAQIAVAPDGSAQASVGEIQNHAIAADDGAAHGFTNCGSTTVEELRASGLPEGTSFTVSAKLEINWNNSGTHVYEVSGGWKISLGDDPSASGLEVRKDADTLSITYPDGTTETRSIGNAGGAQTVTCVLGTTVAPGTKIRIDSTAQAQGTVGGGEAAGEIFDWTADVAASQN